MIPASRDARAPPRRSTPRRRVADVLVAAEHAVAVGVEASKTAVGRATRSRVTTPSLLESSGGTRSAQAARSRYSVSAHDAVAVVVAAVERRRRPATPRGPACRRRCGRRSRKRAAPSSCPGGAVGRPGPASRVAYSVTVSTPSLSRSSARRTCERLAAPLAAREHAVVVAVQGAGSVLRGSRCPIATGMVRRTRRACSRTRRGCGRVAVEGGASSPCHSPARRSRRRRCGPARRSARCDARVPRSGSVLVAGQRPVVVAVEAVEGRRGRPRHSRATRSAVAVAVQVAEAAAAGLGCPRSGCRTRDASRPAVVVAVEAVEGAAVADATPSGRSRRRCCGPARRSARVLDAACRT